MRADGSARLARLASHVVPQRLAAQQQRHRHPAASSSPRESAAIVAQIERYKEQARASDDPAVQVEANVCAYSDTFVLANRQNNPQLLAHYVLQHVKLLSQEGRVVWLTFTGKCLKFF